jgi:putative transferase (TIGR04331 family)
MKLITFSFLKNLLDYKSKKKIITSNYSYIGEWCLLDDKIEDIRKKRLLKIYEWSNNNNKKKEDIKYLNSLYEKILTNLVSSLNKYHATEYSKKYWELLISRWLWFYIHRVFIHWEISKKAINNYPIKSIFSLNLKDDFFIPENTEHSRSIIQSENNYWSHWIFCKIFKYISKVHFINLSLNSKANIQKDITSLDRKSPYNDTLNIYLHKKKYFFYRLSIPKILRIKLMISNFFLNVKKIKKIIHYTELKHNRDNFYDVKNSNDKLLNFLNLIIPFHFPRIFLENYKILEKNYNKVNWPKKIKYIFTTHGHFFDELFKLYAAKQRLFGTKLAILQHGYGGFFYNNNFFNLLYDVKIADIFGTWGWKKNDKTIPLFLTTVQGKNKKKYYFVKKKKILLELYQIGDFPQRPPNGYLGSKERNEINLYLINGFIKNLRKDLRSNTFCKIVNLTKKHVIKNAILKNYKEIKFIDTKKYTYQIRKKYNLQVGFFLGGGFFEAIYINNPVILIFENKFTEGVDNEMLKVIDLFIKCKICFLNAKEAALFINNNYDHLNEWWETTELQNARKLFCEKYARHSDNPVKLFNKIFN